MQALKSLQQSTDPGNFHGKYCNTINQVSIVYNMLIVNYLYICDCYVGLRYSGYSTIFQNIRASDVSNEFKVKPTVASTRYSCATFSSICNSLCQSRLEKVVKQKKAAITPYGTIGIDSAICKKLRRSITKEIDFVVRSRPSTCTTSLRTGKFYDQNFCCNIYGTTSTCQKNVIG
ncbi:hypothetical protein EB796_023054 [Bugula neritina]|uniref:Uncharacterized protein n=1 Tax=Bugula neritina TaxID=10212 RepID=A0A7J7IZK5_BUGNE|nr:hypothetical protein EB796_023054 [Bugula neritina]